MTAGLAAALLGLAACSPSLPAERPVRDAGKPRFPQLVDMALELDLLIDRFEVTDGEFAEFLASSGYVPADAVSFLSHWPQRDGHPVPPPPSALDLPVRLVSFDDAQAYARWRGKELPSSDEWLRACPSLRDGALPWRGRAFAGACNSVVSGLAAPMPVGSYELGRSPPGCYDMIGNVREWTTTPAGRDRLVVLGGSFRQACSHAGKEGSDGLDPWLGREAPDVRQSDLGFRCVIPGAARVLADAFDQIEALRGEERRAAIAELLRVGQRTYGQNVLLPVVRGRAFERRVRWAVELTKGAAAPLHGQRVELLSPAGGAGGDDLLLVVGDHAILRMARDDGRIVSHVDAPLADATLERERIVAPGGATAIWMEGRHGELGIVEIATGHTHLAGPAPEGRDVVAHWRAGDAWFVQQLDVMRDEKGKPVTGDLPCTRVVRFGVDGTRERVVAGEVLAPAPAHDRGILLVLQHRVDVILPVAGARQQRSDDPIDRSIDRATALEWVALDCLRTEDLALASRWWVGWEPRAVDVPLAPGHEQRLRWTHWRFVPEPAPSGVGGADDVAVEVDTPDDVAQPLVATTLGATCLFNAGNGRFLLLQARDGRIGAPRELHHADGSAAALALLPLGSDDRCDTHLLAADGSELLRLAADGPAVTRVVGRLSVPGALSWSAVSPSGRHLVLRTRGGRWFGFDLERGARSFTLDPADEAAIHPELVTFDGEESLVCQTTPTSAWLRAVTDGRLQDEFGVARPPINQVFAVASKQAGGKVRPEPLVLFDDGRLVALGPPEPTSAQLVADFADVGAGVR